MTKLQKINKPGKRCKQLHNDIYCHINYYLLAEGPSKLGFGFAHEML